MSFEAITTISEAEEGAKRMKAEAQAAAKAAEAAAQAEGRTAMEAAEKRIRCGRGLLVAVVIVGRT